ncbi:MAG: nucleotide exchange factor GrpE [Opitutales bacterium]|nr:nucleotide exchange factor GrpE [Opitutales bacterium]
MAKEEHKHHSDEKEETAANEVPVDEESETVSGKSAEESAEVKDGEETPETSEEIPEVDPLEEARAESKENYQRYLRSVADLENYRKRALKEKEELRKYAVSGLVEDLLPALDNLELGLLSAEGNEAGKSVAQGFVMVVQQIKSILQQHGLEEVNPVGEDFDPHAHEATAHEASEEFAEGKILRVHRKGYKLQGRLLRPAMVVVSSGIPETANEES